MKVPGVWFMLAGVAAGALAQTSTPATQGDATTMPVFSQDTPDGAVRAFLVAMFREDKAGVEATTLETSGREVLLQSAEPVPAEAWPTITRMVTGMKLTPLKVGETFDAGGRTVRVTEAMVNADSVVLTSSEMPLPFVVVRQGKVWKVNAAPLIAARRAAATARARARTRPATRAAASRP
jgi:hypothetical protein